LRPSEIHEFGKRARREYVNLMTGRSQEKAKEFIFARQSLEGKISFTSVKNVVPLWALRFAVCSRQ
jgi:hypothetical protein